MPVRLSRVFCLFLLWTAFIVPPVLSVSIGLKEGTDLVLEADQPIELDQGRREMIARGSAQLTYGDTYLTANHIVVNQGEEFARASGNVILTFHYFRLTADNLTYAFGTGEAWGEHLRMGSPPVYLASPEIAMQDDEAILKNATIFFGEPTRFSPNFSAREVRYHDDGRIEARQVVLRAGRIPLFYFPRLEERTGRVLATVLVSAGVSNHLGIYTQMGGDFSVHRDVKIGAEFDYYTRRGILFGPTLGYDATRDDHAVRGELVAGLISDRGNRGTDDRGEPIGSNRGYADWDHQHRIRENLTMTAMLNYWSDPAFMRDFRPSIFRENQQPATYFESVYVNGNSILSAFVRYQANRFHPVRERLPELRYLRLPTRLPSGIFHELQSSAVLLSERDRLTGETTRSERLDALYRLNRPIHHENWIHFSPVASGRITHYFTTVDGGSFTRVIGETGFDLSATFHSIVDYTNDLWRINGIRHILKPFVEYRYVPRGGKGRERIPRIDRQTIQTFLEPLDLSRRIHIDDLHDFNTVRTGLEQTWQTRDREHGSRNLARVLLAADYRFVRPAGARPWAPLFGLVEFTPVYWFTLQGMGKIDPSENRFDDNSIGMEIKDADRWALSFAGEFRRRELEQYAVDGFYRLNERFSFFTELYYNARQHRFTEQVYGLSQRIHNSWEIDYQVTLRDGVERESSFGFGLNVRLLNF